MKITLGGNAQSTQGSSSQLGVGIHDVKFISLTNETIEKKDGSAKFDVIKIKFEGINDAAGKGYEHTVFEPRPGDDERKDNNFGYQNPSSVEEMSHMFFHLIAAVAPKTYEEILKKGDIDIDGWAKFKAFIIKVVTPAAGKVDTQIKLVPNKDGKGVFPSFVLGMGRDNKTYPRTNFIGNGLTYTANELKQIEAKASARPTNMSAIVSTIGAPSNVSIEDDLDLDLDIV